MAYLNKEFVANQVLKAEELNGIVSYINGLDNQALQDQIDKHQATLNEWKDRLDKAEKDVNQLAQNLSDAALESLKKELGDAKNKYADALKKIEDAKALIEDGKVIIANTLSEIKAAQDKINEAKDILADLAGSEGSAGHNILEALGRVETLAEWYDTNEETIANISSILDAVEATKQDVVDFIDTNGETITTLTTALKGKDGLIISVAELVDTVNDNKTTVTSELNALKALIDQNAENINTNTGNISSAHSRIDGVNSSIQNQATALSVFGNRVLTVETNVKGLGAEISAKGSDIDTLKGTVGEFNTRISAAESKAETAISTANTALGDVIQYKLTIDAKLGEYNTSLSDVQTKVGTVSEIQESWKTAGLNPEMIQRVATYDDPSLMIESSTIAVLKDKIGLITSKADGENVINSAAIVAAINDSESSVTIKADKINLIGDTLADKLSTIDLSIGGDSSRFNSNGSGYVANGAISWDEKGNLDGVNINAPMYVNSIDFDTEYNSASIIDSTLSSGYILYAQGDKIFWYTGSGTTRKLYCRINSVTRNITISTSSYGGGSLVGYPLSIIDEGDTAYIAIPFGTSTSYKLYIFKATQSSITKVYESSAVSGGNSISLMYKFNGKYFAIMSTSLNDTYKTQTYSSTTGLSWSTQSITSESPYDPYSIQSDYISNCFETTIQGTKYMIYETAKYCYFSSTDGINLKSINRSYNTGNYDTYVINTQNGAVALLKNTAGYTGQCTIRNIVKTSTGRLEIPINMTATWPFNADFLFVNFGTLKFFNIDNYTVIPCVDGDYTYMAYTSAKNFHTKPIYINGNYSLKASEIYYYKNGDDKYLIYSYGGSNYVINILINKVDLVSYVLDMIG